MEVLILAKALVFFTILSVRHATAEPGDTPEVKEELIKFKNELRKNSLHARENMTRRKMLIEILDLMIEWLNELAFSTRKSLEKKSAQFTELNKNITTSLRVVYAKVKQIHTESDSLILEIDEFLKNGGNEDALSSIRYKARNLLSRDKAPLEELRKSYNELLTKVRKFAVYAINRGFRLPEFGQNYDFDLSPMGPYNENEHNHYVMSLGATIGEIFLVFVYCKNLPPISKEQMMASCDTLINLSRELMRDANYKKTFATGILEEVKALEEHIKAIEGRSNNLKDTIYMNRFHEEKKELIKEKNMMDELYRSISPDFPTVKIALGEVILELDKLATTDGANNPLHISAIRNILKVIKTIESIIKNIYLTCSKLSESYNSAKVHFSTAKSCLTESQKDLEEDGMQTYGLKPIAIVLVLLAIKV
ncbi:signal peptide-containing protein [Theileria equi strain WA]|uniref:Signal peptide-containing protein n=1 Tax=Theileria equi strain WA TaxID=1537102 RepID=L0AV95_THEEQ|nr:signal peptide-containing protein [Theileria equi strain WA]AFZ79460.1 signal peptide-containing protein [Theileria equi strain WA]|eukprot:XP_004829126.1 signal peptide-containing protein [Theileria equi strain WA]